MSKYDQECAREFAALENRIDKYFVDVTVNCPYNMVHLATFYQGLFGPLSERVMELFLTAGYRRNGNCLYTMHCEKCDACIPIRLHPKVFRPNRNQKRVWKKNKDVDVTIGVINPNHESLDLCDNFLQERYPHKGNTAAAYYSGFFLNKIVSTYEIRYRLKGRLIGNAVVDIGSNWLNAVYFFFDQNEAKRSPGILNILTMIKFCQQKNIEYLYLGYIIDELSSMNYKKRFNPCFLYQDSRWSMGR